MYYEYLVIVIVAITKNKQIIKGIQLKEIIDYKEVKQVDIVYYKKVLKVHLLKIYSYEENIMLHVGMLIGVIH